MSRNPPTARTLRARLTLWHLTALAVTLTAFAGLVHSVVSTSLYQHHDQELGQQAEELVDWLRSRPLTDATLGDAVRQAETAPRFVLVRDRRGELLFESQIPSLYEPNIGLHEALVHAARSAPRAPLFFTATLERAGAVRFICVPMPSGDLFLQVGDSLGDLRETLNTVAVASISLIPVVLIVSGLVGWIVVKRALAPVRSIAAALDEIDARDLSGRIRAAPDDPELGALVVTLNRLLDRLERAFESLRQFAGDVSHQIQTPLMIIRGTVDTARGGEESGGAPAWTDTVAREVDDIRAIIADLRSLALADAPLNGAADVGLTELVAETGELVAALGELHGVVVDCRVEPGITVRGDATRLKQLVLNLGDNAVKYTPSGGAVTIELVASGRSALLRVSDTGIGIAEADLPHLFERHFRSDSADRRADGTGLGLTIAKRIVDAHRGIVEVTSRPGAGSTFVVRLPRV